MSLYDVNQDDTRLRPRLGLGNVSESTLDAESGSAGGFTPYEDVTDTSAPTIYTASQPLVPVFDAATGTSTCVGAACPGDVPTTAYQSTAITPATSRDTSVAATVTPLPAAPKTINWLLVLVGGGLAWVLLHGNDGAGLNGAPEPAPAPALQDLGRPPRRKAPKLKRVESLKIS